MLEAARATKQLEHRSAPHEHPELPKDWQVLAQTVCRVCHKPESLHGMGVLREGSDVDPDGVDLVDQ